MNLWLTRDREEEEKPDYDLWMAKPLLRERDESRFWIDDYRKSIFTLLFRFCPEPFEKVTGIKIKPGEIRKVKSIKIELE